MEKGSNVLKFLKGALLGGLFAVIGLFALLATFAVLSKEPLAYAELTLAITTLVLSALATAWAAGFWGNWGMVLFFLAAPVVLIVDFAINPFFPAGVLIVASVAYGARRKNEANA